MKVRSLYKLGLFFTLPLLVFSILVFSLFLGACSKGVTEEDRVKRVVKDVEKAAESKDVKGFMRHVSKDYNDDRGNDYDGVKGILFYQFLRAEKVSVFVRGVEVEVRGDRALVNTKVVMVRGKEIEKIEDIIPEDAAGYRFSVVFRNEDGDWKALSARWDNVGVIGLL
jgi:ketosteroid isomerase-like protein